MTINAIGRKHWTVKANEAKRWRQIIVLMCRQLNICDLNLAKAELILTRYSSSEPDFDNLASSFKHVIDGLVEARVIIDDKPSVLKQVRFEWEKVSRKDGKIRVRIFSLGEELLLSSQNQQST